MKTLREMMDLVEAAQRQGVAEGELETYQVSVMDTQTKEHWTIEVKVTSAQAAKERAEAQGFKVLRVKKEQGVAEGVNDTVYPNAQVIKSKNGKPIGEIYQDSDGTWGAFHYRADRGADGMDSREDAIEELRFIHSETGRSRPDYTVKGVAEGWSDYDDNQYSLTDSTGKELTLLRGNTPEEAIERAKQLIGSNEKLLATFGLVKLTPRPHYIVRNAKRQGVAEGEVKQFPKKHRGDLEDTHSCVKCGGDLQGGTYMGHKVKVCMPCKQVYLPPNTGIDQRGNKVDEQGVAEEQVEESTPDALAKIDDLFRK